MFYLPEASHVIIVEEVKMCEIINCFKENMPVFVTAGKRQRDNPIAHSDLFSFKYLFTYDHTSTFGNA